MTKTVSSLSLSLPVHANCGFLFDRRCTLSELHRARNKLWLVSISSQSSFQQVVGWISSGRPYNTLSHTPSARRVLQRANTHRHRHTHRLQLRFTKPLHIFRPVKQFSEEKVLSRLISDELRMTSSLSSVNPELCVIKAHSDVRLSLCCVQIAALTT